MGRCPSPPPQHMGVTRQASPSSFRGVVLLRNITSQSCCCTRARLQQPSAPLPASVPRAGRRARIGGMYGSPLLRPLPRKSLLPLHMALIALRTLRSHPETKQARGTRGATMGFVSAFFCSYLIFYKATSKSDGRPTKRKKCSKGKQLGCIHWNNGRRIDLQFMHTYGGATTVRVPCTTDCTTYLNNC